MEHAWGPPIEIDDCTIYTKCATCGFIKEECYGIYTSTRFFTDNLHRKEYINESDLTCNEVIMLSILK